MHNKVIMVLSSSDIRKDARVNKEAVSLVNAGYQVTVCAWDRENASLEEETVNGFLVKYFKVKSSYGNGLFQIPALLRFYSKVFSCLEKTEFSIIHCHDLETLPFGRAVKKKMGKKLVFDAHEPEYFSDARRFRFLMILLGKIIERIYCKFADHIIVTNEFQKDKYAGFGLKNISIVANYPDKSLIANQKRYLDTKNSFIIGRIGALYHDMGIEELIDAYSKLYLRNDKIKLLLVGRSIESYKKQIVFKIREAKGSIQFIDSYNFSDLRKIYEKIDLSVLPQKKTKWFRNITPTKLFESLACGVPVVTTDIGDIGNIVKGENCGIILGSPNSEEIALKLSEALTNKAMLEEMSRNAILAVKTKYNWEISKTKLLNIYSGLNMEGTG